MRSSNAAEFVIRIGVTLLFKWGERKTRYGADHNPHLGEAASSKLSCALRPQQQSHSDTQPRGAAFCNAVVAF